MKVGETVELFGLGNTVIGQLLLWSRNVLKYLDGGVAGDNVGILFKRG